MAEDEANAGALWLSLPKCLLEEIFNKLLLTHLTAASSVCSSWRSVGRDVIRRLLIRSVGLVVPGDNTETRSLLLPTIQSNVYTYNDVSNALNVPVPHHFYCCGSSFGWLFLVDDSLDMHLFNPLSGSKIELPPGTTAGAPQWRVERFGKCFMRKAFLSCKPVSSSLSQTYALMLYLDKMVFCRLGDKVWTLVNNPGPGFRNYMDAAYYRDKFYVVYNPGAFVTVDINANVDQPVVVDYGLTPPGELFSHPRYLVEANGELFQVRRYVNHDGDTVSESDNENAVVFNWGAHIDGRGGADNEDEDNDDDAKAEENHEDNSAKNGNNGNGEAEEHVEDGNIKNEVNNDCGKEEENDEDNSDAGEEKENDKVNSASGEEEGNDKDNSDAGEEEKNGEDVSKNNHNEWARCYSTIRFKIFKLRGCSCCGHPGWEKVESIGDNAFFLGANTAFSLSASDFPGYKPNSIYFTDNYREDPYGLEAIRHDIGVYSVEDKTVEHIYPIDSKPVRPTPFWFAPSHGKS